MGARQSTLLLLCCSFLALIWTLGLIVNFGIHCIMKWLMLLRKSDICTTAYEIWPLLHVLTCRCFTHYYSYLIVLLPFVVVSSKELARTPICEAYQLVHSRNTRRVIFDVLLFIFIENIKI